MASQGSPMRIASAADAGRPMTLADLEQIESEAGVSAILSVQHDDCLTYWGIDYAEIRIHGERLGFRMKRRPMRDFDIPDQQRNLAEAVRALAAD